MEAPGVLCYHYPLFLPAFMPAASSFFLLSIIIVSQPLTPLRRLLRLQSVTQNARDGSLREEAGGGVRSGVVGVISCVRDCMARITGLPYKAK